MYVKNLFFVALFGVLILSCKKEKTQKPGEGEVIVKIEKMELHQYDNIDVEASVQGIPEADIWHKGFYWSISPQRRKSDSTVKKLKAEDFSATINGIGQNSTLYLRAYVETYNETYFSDSIVINTSGLQLLWNKEHAGGQQFIKQIIPLGNDGFLLLAERLQGAVNRSPELIRMDAEGNVQWTRQFYTGEIKSPQYLMPVTDGYLIATSIGVRGPSAVFVFKTDLQGNRLWEKTLSGKAYQDFVRMKLMPDQSVRVTLRGYEAIVNNARVNVSIDDYTLDGNGQIISATALPNNNALNAGMAEMLALNTPDGGFLNSHASEQVSINGGLLAMQKFNNANQLMWEQSYPLTGTAYPDDLRINNAGNYMLMGQQMSTNMLMEIDQNSGTKLWGYTYESWKYRNAARGMLSIGNDGYYIIADGRSLFDQYKNGPLLVKLDLQGKYVYEHMHFQEGQPVTIFRTDALYTNANKEIFLFGNVIRSSNEADVKLFVMKWKER